MGYSAFFSPDQGDYPVMCIHEELTGNQCPSCGTSHAFSLILQGRMNEAAQWNNYALRVFLFFLLQFFMRIFLSLRYMRETDMLLRNSIVTSDVVVTVIMFLLAFMPYLKFIVVTAASLF
jgi:hypothetical protein